MLNKGRPDLDSPIYLPNEPVHENTALSMLLDILVQNIQAKPNRMIPVDARLVDVSNRFRQVR